MTPFDRRALRPGGFLVELVAQMHREQRQGHADRAVETMRRIEFVKAHLAGRHAEEVVDGCEVCAARDHAA